jgi:hypothetical protein
MARLWRAYSAAPGARQEAGRVERGGRVRLQRQRLAFELGGQQLGRQRGPEVPCEA